MANDKNIKVRDLKPSKDAKGGGASRQGASRQGASRQGGSLQGASRNNKQRLGNRGGGHN
ncbi:MAG TPA: hypothetical protein VJ719_09965 [Chthoniobacterales bacterium]|nr:hypothetical protein [Chthoniobacterales bacterium]